MIGPGVNNEHTNPLRVATEVSSQVDLLEKQTTVI